MLHEEGSVCVAHKEGFVCSAQGRLWERLRCVRRLWMSVLGTRGTLGGCVS